ncbi:MAG: hypothetical protein AAF928_04365 [Myxococcota bacterium]
MARAELRRHRGAPGWGALFFALWVSACTGADEVPTRPAGGLPTLGSDCDPMVPAFCGLPFPSDVYLLDDPDGRNPSGRSVRFGPTTLPARRTDGASIPPDLFFDHDGFSPGQAAMTYLPFASLEGCATPFDIERSLEADSPTVLLEADTLRRVPHWVDLDATTDRDGTAGRPDERLVMVRPAERLRDGTRYIVAMRNIVDRRDGATVPPSPVFAALREGRSLDDDEGDEAARWSVFARREAYDDIFGRLASAGVGRDDLQVAWDYTTATRENNTSPMLEMRDLALAAVGEAGPPFEVVGVDEDFNDQILRRIEVRMEVPLFLTSASEGFEPGQIDRLNWSAADGALTQNGTMTQEVVILVPRSVATEGPHGLLQNGHGLFGSRTEGNGGYLTRIAAEGRYIAFATNYFGFDVASISVGGEALVGNFPFLKSFTERQIQGQINQLLAMRMMRGRVATEGIVADDGTVLLDPQWVDASRRYYRGDSQGGIMGATYMAVSTDVTRGVLAEPGMPYNLLLDRSASFGQFFIILRAGFGDGAVAKQLALAAVQMGWDRAEPNGFAPFIERDPLPGTPSHRVLLYGARGDHLVTTFGAHLMARAIGATHLQSDDGAVHAPIFGLEPAAPPGRSGSVYVDYDFGLAPNPRDNLPNRDGCDPHERIRRMASHIAQSTQFFETGEVAWSCDGVCDCVDPDGSPTEEADCRTTFASVCR